MLSSPNMSNLNVTVINIGKYKNILYNLYILKSSRQFTCFS